MTNDLPRALRVKTVTDSVTGEDVTPQELERRQEYRREVKRNMVMLHVSGASDVCGETVTEQERLAREAAGRELVARQEELARRAGSPTPLVSLLRVQEALENRLAKLEQRVALLEAAPELEVADAPRGGLLRTLGLQ